MKARDRLLAAEEGEIADEVHVNRAAGWRHVDDDAQFSDEYNRAHGLGRKGRPEARNWSSLMKQWDGEIAESERRHKGKYG